MHQRHNGDFELMQKISDVARPWHPAKLPSRVDLADEGTVSFIQSLTEDTPIGEIVFHAFRGLSIGPKKVLGSHIDTEAVKFEATEHDDITVDGNSALHQIFRDFVEFASVTDHPGSSAQLERAERFGWFIVENARDIVQSS